MGVSFLGLNIPTSAAEAGNNLHNNAVQTGQDLAARGREAAAIPGNIAGGLQDFFHGLATGHALGQTSAQAPQTTTKAQAKPVAIGGKFVELPGVGRVQMPSEAFLHSHPAEAVDMSTAAPAKAATSKSGSAKATNPFDEAIARYAQASGGISLNELAALSRSAAETSVLRTQPKDPSAKDVAGLQLKDMADQLFTGKMSQAQALKAKDPAGAAKLQDEAVKERMDVLKAILGANPVDLQTAAAMGGTGGE
jgi:hypothetical protein